MLLQSIEGFSYPDHCRCRLLVLVRETGISLGITNPKEPGRLTSIVVDPVGQDNTKEGKRTCYTEDPLIFLDLKWVSSGVLKLPRRTQVPLNTYSHLEFNLQRLGTDE